MNQKIQSAHNAYCELAQELSLPLVTLQSILVLFYQEHKTLPQLTAKHIQNENWPALEAYLHKIKGASSSLRMMAIRHQAWLLEDQLKAGKPLNLEQMQPLYYVLQKAIDLYQLDALSNVKLE